MEFRLTQELLDTIDQYVKGELEGEKLLAFENELKQNAPLREEMIIQKQLFRAIESNNEGPDPLTDDEENELQEKINSPAYQDLSKKIKHIGNEYVQNPVLEKKPLWIRFKRLIPAVAAILVIVVISTVYLTNENQSIDKYYYDNNNWDTELTSFAEKGDSKSDFVKAETFFKANDYAKAIQAFETLNQEDELYPYSLMYIGASHANLNQDQQALEAFNKLAAMKEFGESSKGLWYAALIYLKLEDRGKAIASLKEITKDSINYRYEDALGIIKELQ